MKSIKEKFTGNTTGCHKVLNSVIRRMSKLIPNNLNTAPLKSNKTIVCFGDLTKTANRDIAEQNSLKMAVSLVFMIN